jgi:hypothetical protein
MEGRDKRWIKLIRNPILRIAVSKCKQEARAEGEGRLTLSEYDFVS